jgi:hypothetical protein
VIFTTSVVKNIHETEEEARLNRDTSPQQERIKVEGSQQLEKKLYAAFPVIWIFIKLHFAMMTKLVIWNMVRDM